MRNSSNTATFLSLILNQKSSNQTLKKAKSLRPLLRVGETHCEEATKRNEDATNDNGYFVDPSSANGNDSFENNFISELYGLRERK